MRLCSSCSTPLGPLKQTDVSESAEPPVTDKGFLSTISESLESFKYPQKHHCRICMISDKDPTKSYFCKNKSCGNVFQSGDEKFPICNTCIHDYNITPNSSPIVQYENFKRSQVSKAGNIATMKSILSESNINFNNYDELSELYGLFVNPTSTTKHNTNKNNLLLLIYENIKENLSFYEDIGIVLRSTNNQSLNIQLTSNFKEKLRECDKNSSHHSPRNDETIRLFKIVGWNKEKMIQQLKAFGIIIPDRYLEDNRYIEKKFLYLLKDNPQLLVQFRNKTINNVTKEYPHIESKEIISKIKPALKAVLLLPKKSLSWFETLTFQEEEFSTFDEEVNGFKLLAAIYFKYPSLFDDRINSHKRWYRFEGTSDFEDQYGRKFTDHTCKELIFGNLTTDDLSFAIVLDKTILQELLKKRTELITQKSILEGQLKIVQNNTEKVKLAGEYIPLLKQLMVIDARLQSHYLSTVPKNSALVEPALVEPALAEPEPEPEQGVNINTDSFRSAYSRRLLHKYQLDGQYSSFFKKINGSSPLQFSTLVTDYTEDEQDEDTRICCFASGLARLILAIDLYKSENLLDYIQLQKQMLVEDSNELNKSRSDYQSLCNNQFNEILKHMNLKFKKITTADTHALSKIKTAFHRFTDRLPNCVINVTDLIGITNPFTQKFDAISIQAL